MKPRHHIFSSLKSVMGSTMQRRNVSWDRLRALEARDVEHHVREIFRSPYFYIVVGLLIGGIITIQIKNETKRPLSNELFTAQLLDIRAEALAEAAELKETARELQSSIDEEETSLTKSAIMSQSFSSDLAYQQMLLGATEVAGSGIQVSISDGELQIKDEFAKSLTHAADLRDIVNLLWYSGAEAISINGERIIFNTSIDCIVSTILINTNHYVPPFTIKAVGSTQDMMGVMKNSRKLIDIKKRADKKQINFDIKSEQQIRIEKSTGTHIS